jgi:hypothetical protein
MAASRTSNPASVRIFSPASPARIAPGLRIGLRERICTALGCSVSERHIVLIRERIRSRQLSPGDRS